MRFFFLITLCIFESLSGNYDPLFRIHRDKNNISVVVFSDENRKDSMEYFIHLKDSLIIFPNGLSCPYPLKKIGCCAVTHFSYLNELNSLDLLICADGLKYLSSKYLISQAEKYRIREIGSETGLNKELVISCGVDAFFINITGSPYDPNSALDMLKMPYIVTYEWKESSLLNKAKWIELMGVFIGKEKEAEKIYQMIHNQYMEYKNIQIEKKRNKILWASIFNGQVWLAGNRSYVANMLNDAGLELINPNLRASAGQVTLEFFFELFSQAETFVYSAPIKNLKELISIEPRLSNHESFQDTRIIALSDKYYDEGLLRPHEMLKELKLIFSNDENHNLKYFHVLKK